MSATANIKIHFDKGVIYKAKESIRKGVESMALAFERTAKETTTNEKHIITGRYRASINLNAGDGIIRPTVPETQGDDGIHKFVSPFELHTGSNVEYAKSLEKRYGLLARSLDMSRNQMEDMFALAFKKSFEGKQ